VSYTADPQLRELTYYQLRTPEIRFERPDVDGCKRCVLSRGDYVLCVEFLNRSGSNGRGRYAKLLYQNEHGDRITLFYRVSRYNRGQAQWQELNPMLAIALSDKIPTL
jgi:hypothetical protein